jgi:hypothetical protein
MTSEEFIKLHEYLLQTASKDVSSYVKIKKLLEVAWNEGYKFKIQEEELNKGASF